MVCDHNADYTMRAAGVGCKPARAVVRLALREFFLHDDTTFVLRVNGRRWRCRVRANGGSPDAITCTRPGQRITARYG